jgi:hypothetical protein
MDEIQLILVGILVLGASVTFFFYTDLVPKQITNTEMNIIVSLGVGVLIFIVDKRQNSYFNEIIQIQHKLTREIHEMLTEEIRLINEMKRENNRG